MSFLNPFFTDKTLVTILKVFPLNQDVQEIILWKIIDSIVMDIFTIYNCEEVIDFDDQNYYYQDYYDFYDLIDD